MKLKLIVTMTGLAVCTTLPAQWSTSGNLLSGTATAPSQWLGSTTAFDLILKTNSTERLRLANTTGYVTIGGTAGASERLQVQNGNILLDPYAPSPGVNGTGNLYFGGITNASPSQNGMRLSFNPSTLNGYIDLRTTPTSTNGLIFRVDNNNGGTERMRINSDGKVCVGCSGTAPTEKLEVVNGIFKLAGPSTAGGPMIFFNASSTSAYAADWGIEYRSATTGGYPGLNFWKPNGSVNWGNNYLFLSDNTHVGIHTNNPTAQLTVDGNVLIGDPATVTLPTGYKLYVQSGILTEKVKVAVVNSASWADHVFNLDYKLRDIRDLETYVKANKHLPNIPSAAEVVTDGIDVAGMDAKLLEKIEELSLYIIQLNKEVEALKARLPEK